MKFVIFYHVAVLTRFVSIYADSHQTDATAVPTRQHPNPQKPEEDDATYQFRTYDAQWQNVSFKPILVPASRPYYFARPAAQPSEPDSARLFKSHSAPLPSRSRTQLSARSTSMPKRAATSDVRKSPSSRLSDTEYATKVRLPDKREYKIRRFIRLQDDRENERYRVLEKEAERAFITRSYRFVNPEYNADKMVRFINTIEDDHRTKPNYAVYTEHDLLSHFEHLDNDAKSSMCRLYVNYSHLLAQQRVLFDERTVMEAYRTVAIVQYDHPELARYTDTVRIIICPCVFPKHWRRDDDRATEVLGIAPLSLQRYARQYEAEHYTFEKYAFIYKIVEFDGNRIVARVWGLSRMDYEKFQRDVELDEKAEEQEKIERRAEEKRKQIEDSKLQQQEARRIRAEEKKRIEEEKDKQDLERLGKILELYDDS